MPDDHELHRLLELPRGASPDAIRFAYERHMAAAVRSDDHQQALRLSAGFNALPPSLRDAVYPRLTTRTPHGSGGSRRKGGGARPSRHDLVVDDHERRRGFITLTRVLSALLIVAALGAWGFWRASHPGVGLSAALPPDVALPSHSSAVTAHRIDLRPARFDARSVITAVDQCRRAHETPVRSFHQVGRRLHFTCGGTRSRVLLTPGDRVWVIRHERQVIVYVTAPNSHRAHATLRAPVHAAGVR